MKDMEDYLARIERINRVVGGIMDEVKTGKPRAEPEAAESKPQATRYSADYSRWEKIDAELEEQEKKEKKESEEMALCREEADRSKQMGNKKFGEGHYAEAHEAYSRAIILEPDNIVHPLNRALCNIKLCRWEQALKDCETVLKEEPHNPKALKRKATVLQNTEQFEAALGVWERVLKMNPRSVEAKDNILWVKKEMSERGKLQQFVESASSGLVDKLQDLLGRFVKAVGEYLAAECSAREAAASAPAPGDAGPAATPEPAPEGTPTSAPGPAAPAPGGAGTASPDAAAERSARVLACLGLLPELLLEDGAQIYFRVHGGQRALLDLLGHIIGREGPLGAILGLVVEGAYEALGYLLPNESNLAMVVEAEKKAVDGGRAALSLVSHAVYCVTEGEPPVSRAAMHFIATATAHAWVCAHLRRLLSAAQMCAFPTHGMSGRTLAFIAKIIDNCLRTAAWQEEFEAVDVLGFLMRFARAEYPILRQNVAGCVMRLTTVDGYRAKLLETSEGGAYRHVPALVQMFKAEVIPKGSRTVAFRAGFVVEAVLSAFINCMTLCPEQRRALCDALRPEGVFEDAVALAVSYTGERGAVEGAALPVVCRSLNLLAKCVAFREVLELVWGSEALMRSLPALANGFGLVVAEPGAPEGDAAQYQEVWLCAPSCPYLPSPCPIIPCLPPSAAAPSLSPSALHCPGAEGGGAGGRFVLIR